ncbi:MAG: NAD-dependent malic enzyme [Nevskia sp.]|nr:NAD-dependent malic enzyme [Nevskia sp.]
MSAATETIETALRGAALLSTPLLNKGTAFSEAERDAFGLHGLLPPQVLTLDDQLARNGEAYRRCVTDLDRHVFLRDLQDRNEVLFYALLRRHIGEMLPMVYAPTVAQGCQHFSHLYRKPRGLFLSFPLRHRLREMLANRPHREVKVIVVTDGERVLGIGDQGIGGMGIPIGKLTLYSLLGGIHPRHTLPVFLDVGTNNAELRKDPLYLGWRAERIADERYWQFIEEFVRAVGEALPDVLLQWEDFAKPHARPILERYADRLCTFNDDIQGTAAMALGTVLAALRALDQPLPAQNIVIVGAGGAGTGIAEYLLAAMRDAGASEREALARFYLVDAEGLLHEGMRGLTPVQRRFAQPAETIAGWPRSDLAEVVRRVRPSILIGASGQPGLFTEEVVRTLSAAQRHPVILPLSNPGDRAEAQAADLVRWSEGRALVASGSPCAPVEYGGRRRSIGQANNLYIFPAVGLAVAASGARRVSDGMLRAAARALAELSPATTDLTAPLLPPLDVPERISLPIAHAIARQAQREGLAAECEEAVLRERLERGFWKPRYPRLKPISGAQVGSA